MKAEIYTISGVIGSPLELAVDWSLYDCFAAVQYFDSDPTTGTAAEVVPTLGTVTIQAQLVNHGKYVDVADGVLTASAVNSFTSFKGNASKVKATATGVDVATHYSLTVSQNG
jgi:hypothetical protein